uniref:Uncharacterized protein n=2 Tax=Cercopithecinae TaxID=9528 RepID=A0A2K5XGG4_MANLE
MYVINCWLEDIMEVNILFTIAKKKSSNKIYTHIHKYVMYINIGIELKKSLRCKSLFL